MSNVDENIDVKKIAVPDTDSIVSTALPVHILPSLYLFSEDYQHTKLYSLKLKYVVYLLANGTQTSRLITDEEVCSFFAAINVYTFDWKRIPKSIFFKIFKLLSHIRITFLVGYFRCWDNIIYNTDSDKKKMIGALWDHFQKPQCESKTALPVQQCNCLTNEEPNQLLQNENVSLKNQITSLQTQLSQLNDIVTNVMKSLKNFI